MRRSPLFEKLMARVEAVLCVLLLGALLAWPLWSSVGIALSLLVVFGLVGTLLLVSHFSPRERKLIAMLWRRQATPIVGPTAEPLNNHRGLGRPTHGLSQQPTRSAPPDAGSESAV